jgi:hypothetical protein
MAEPTKYKVICQKCKGNDILTILPDRTVYYTEHTPIIAARYRSDMNWGFECTCGQDSRVAPEEKSQLEQIVRGGEHSIARIAKSLTPKNELKFEMLEI